MFGGTAAERIQFNEDTLWAGGPRDYSHAGAAGSLPEIRRLLFEGKQREAEALAMEKFMSVPLRQVAYQPFGDLLLEFPGHEEVTGYRRELDLDAAVVATQYEHDGVTFVRGSTRKLSRSGHGVACSSKSKRLDQLQCAFNNPSPGSPVRRQRLGRDGHTHRQGRAL